MSSRAERFTCSHGAADNVTTAGTPIDRDVSIVLPALSVTLGAARVVVPHAAGVYMACKSTIAD
jgi:hypothetical protein